MKNARKIKQFYQSVDEDKDQKTLEDGKALVLKN